MIDNKTGSDPILFLNWSPKNSLSIIDNKTDIDPNWFLNTLLQLYPRAAFEWQHFFNGHIQSEPKWSRGCFCTFWNLIFCSLHSTFIALSSQICALHGAFFRFSLSLLISFSDESSEKTTSTNHSESDFHFGHHSILTSSETGCTLTVVNKRMRRRDVVYQRQ